jgi:hypothetical protein
MHLSRNFLRRGKSSSYITLDHDQILKMNMHKILGRPTTFVYLYLHIRDEGIDGETCRSSVTRKSVTLNPSLWMWRLPFCPITVLPEGRSLPEWEAEAVLVGGVSFLSRPPWWRCHRISLLYPKLAFGEASDWAVGRGWVVHRRGRCPQDLSPWSC